MTEPSPALESGPQTLLLHPIRDTYLRGHLPNRNFGTEDFLRVRRPGTNRALVDFDQAEIAEIVGTGTVESATLRLHVDSVGSNWGPHGRTVDAHRITTAWTELGATWSCPEDPAPDQHADCDPLWDGGEFDPSPTATLLHSNDLTGWVEFDVTADVRAALQGTPGFGWLIKKTDEDRQGWVRYDSRESAEPPELVVTFLSESVPPTLEFTAPPAVVVNDLRPQIVLVLTSGSAEIAPETLSVILDGTAIEETCEGLETITCIPPLLAPGTHTLTASVEDLVGNAGSASQAFEIFEDAFPPDVKILTPVEGEILASATAQVTGTATDDSYIASLEVNGTPVEVSGGAFSVEISLAEGENTIAAVATDGAGTSGSAEVRVTIDTVAPVLGVEEPDRSTLPGHSAVDVHVSYTDETTGIDTRSLALLLDGIDRLDGCSVRAFEVRCFDLETPPGDHLLEAQVADRAGNVAQLSFPFSTPTDSAAPTVTISSPGEGARVRTPTIRVAGRATDNGLVAEVLVGGAAAILEPDGSFSAVATLSEGDNLLEARATDLAGNEATATATVVLDSTAPVLEDLDPASGARTHGTSIRVSGRVADSTDVSQLEVGGLSITPSPDGRFESLVPLSVGENLILVSAADSLGNERRREILVEQVALPQLQITSPAFGLITGASEVEVRGVAGPGILSVSVNGVIAQLQDGNFVADPVALAVGANEIVAVGATAQGTRAISGVAVVRDTAAPRLHVDFPLEGSVVFSESIPVYGLVNDIVPGTVNAEQVSVSVNGLPAAIANRRFLVEEIPLTLGTNEIEVMAVDAHGNHSTRSLTVERQSPSAPRLSAVAGNLQQGPISTVLEESLRVLALDAAGNPVAQVPVVFRTVGNDGTFLGGERSLVVSTDSSGLAEAEFRLGTRASAGGLIVSAAATGFGEARFVATTLPGEPALLIQNAGNVQTGNAGRPLPEPMSVVLTDSGFNRLAGYEVRFEVIEGEGSFSDGTQSVSVQTNSDGEAAVFLTLDPVEGLVSNRVLASVVSFPTIPTVTFQATGQVADPFSETSISGVVYDGSDIPVPGVTLFVRGTSLTTRAAEDGSFSITGVPVVPFFLEADGSTAERPGTWPHLEFKIYPVQGREAVLPRPVYLLPLEANGLFVDEATGGTLTLPEVPGFALEVAPGSATFPDGSRSGEVTVTSVHVDKIPMTPGFGQQPRFIVTIQPAGTAFEPPARLTLPNSDGLAPGQTTELYSFDHDLGSFVSIGPATVSRDGSVVVANDGVGVIKAGWHCGGNPTASGTPYECGDCGICDATDECIPVPDGALCDDKDACTLKDRCVGGKCFGTDPVTASPIEGPCALAYNESGSFTTESNAPEKLGWFVFEGATLLDSGSGPNFSASIPDVFGGRIEDVLVNVGCRKRLQSNLLYLGPACGPFEEPELTVSERSPTFRADVWGYNRNDLQVADFEDCMQDQRICSTITEIHRTLEFGVREADEDGRVRWSGEIERDGEITEVSTDVHALTGAFDDAITAETCEDVFRDIYPTECAIPSSPTPDDLEQYGEARTAPRRSYTYVPSTRAHEFFHATDYMEKVALPAVARAPDLAREEGCSCVPPGEHRRSRLSSAFLDLEIELLMAFDPGSEERAYEEGNRVLKSLAMDIQSRARAEGWPAFCQNAVSLLEAEIEMSESCQ